MQKITRYILVFALSIAIISLIILFKLKVEPKPSPLEQRIAQANPVSLGGDFILHTMNGEIFDTKDYRGKYLLIYFGFTYCPDICPASLVEMNDAIINLQEKSEQLIPIFITIDPRRDTAQQLRNFLPEFNPRIIGLTGSEEEIKKVADLFKVYYARASEADTKNYMINHSSFFYLIGPDGRMIKYYHPNMNAQAMKIDIAKIIN